MHYRPTAAVILAAGRGSRLKTISEPYTKTILLVNELPIIGYAVRAVEPYVDKIIIVAHPLTAVDVFDAARKSLTKTAKDIILTIQSNPMGMGDAMRIGFIALKQDYSVVVLAGDNIVQEDINVKNVLDLVKKDDAVRLAWTYRILPAREAKRFSVFHDFGNGKGELIEKPNDPPSNICWCGPVAFSSSLESIERIKNMSLSSRGEYEATDLMNTYIQMGMSKHVKLTGEWFDIGTPEALEEARRAFCDK